MRNSARGSFSRKKSMSYSAGYKESRSTGEEFGPGKRDMALCPSCSAVYYYKSWHHNMLHFKGDVLKKQDMRVVLCPACAMWKDRHWEGELRIDGIPSQMRTQIKNTILSVADTAYDRDPMDRVFDIKEKGKTMQIFVSENQLTFSIARKLASSLKKHFSKPVIHHGKGEDAVLVTMEWISKGV